MLENVVYFEKKIKTMSRINDLKTQNPSFNVNLIDIINDLFNKKSKYAELCVNLLKNKWELDSSRKEELKNELVDEFGVDEELLMGKSYIEINNIFKTINEFGWNNFELVKKFVNFNERNLIVQNDLTKYKDFEELELQISLAELKSLDKDLEKQTIKLYETNEWLVIKPMSFLASKKYGSNTKWCTTQEHNPEHYLKYSRRGILIYCINKLTGEKVAAFKSIDNMYEKETSFWDSVDNRIDSMESNLPSDVLGIIKYEFNHIKKSNWDLLSDDERNIQLIWLENNSYGRKGNNIGVYREELSNEEMSITYTSDYSHPLRVNLNEIIPRETSVGIDEILD